MQTKIFLQRKLVALSIGLAAFVVSANGETAQVLRKYYAMRDAAVDSLMAEKFDSAAAIFRQAFRHKKHPFERDVKNALFCELKSGAPDTAACRRYFAELGELKYYYKAYARAGIDTLLMAQLGSHLPKNTCPPDEVAHLKIFEMNKRSQEALKAYQRHSLPDSKADSLETLKVKKTLYAVDSINILEMKELVKTVDVFDERIVSHGEFFSLLGSWSGDESVFDFFEPHLRQAVLDGRMSAFDYAGYMDTQGHSGAKGSYDSHRLNICTTSSPNRISNETKYVAYANFNSKSIDDVQRQREVDRRREAIYLSPAIESGIREFKLWQYVQRHDYWQVLRAEPISITCSVDEGRKAIQKMLDEGIPVIYYIEGEHDFNVK